jgi:membrane associated rhomboid family serine protease
MLEDRSYVHEGYERRRTSALTWLVSAMVAIYLVQNLLSRVAGLGAGMEGSFGLSSSAIADGRIWTLLTYGFLHSTGNVLQLVAYVAAVWLLGREILPVTGARRFVGLFGSAIVAGGLCWTAVHWGRQGILVGSSAGVAALAVLYRCFYPNREISFMLFFAPVRFTPRLLVSCLLAADLCGLVFYEIMGMPAPFTAAHSAHLGGMAAGWIYYRYLHDSGWSSADAGVEMPRWMRHRPEPKAPAPAASPASRGHLRAEVDRILDKINSDGLGSLSAEERRVLDEARDSISRS